MANIELYKTEMSNLLSDCKKIKEKKINVYLVRHGQSEQNVTCGTDLLSQNINEERTNGLTPLGTQQATQLGEHFSSVKFQKVYASDFLRAVETARFILEGGHIHEVFNQPEIQVGKELREMDFGDLSHKPYSEKAAHYISFNKPLAEWSLPGGESFREVGRRMIKCLENICDKLFEEINYDKEEKSANVLITSHSLAIVAFLHCLSHPEKNGHSHKMLNWNLETDLKIPNNCCYYKFEVTRSTKVAEQNTVGICLNISVLEKYASTKNASGSGMQNYKRIIPEKEIKLRNFLKMSSKGNEILNCCHQ